MDRSLLEYRPEIEAFEGPETSFHGQPALSATDEMQQAAELLERIDEDELEGYLVELIDRAGRSTGPPVVNALAGILGRVARRLLGPTGAPTAASAGQVFGLELEGLSAEDQAFELARHFVRFASEAARQTGRAVDAGSPQAVARRAASAAARSLAPGLLAPPAGDARPAGTWFRRGRQFIVLSP
jgi:hypothetical protein